MTVHGRADSQESGRIAVLPADPLQEPQISQLWQAIAIVVGLVLPVLVALSGAPNLTSRFLEEIRRLPQPVAPSAGAASRPQPVVAREPAPAVVEPRSLNTAHPASAPVAVTDAGTQAVAMALPPHDVVPPHDELAAAPRVLLDQLPSTDGDTTAWPDDASGNSWFDTSGYVLSANEPNHFVAVSVPLDEQPANVRVSAQFQKTAGPPGGGYGVIVRDRSAATLDGEQQSGRYLIFEVDDRGEFGVWRRAGDVWEDLVAWRVSHAVRTGQDPNILTVEAIDSRLTFAVNGVIVVTLVDDQPTPGGVGVFLGGDFNAAVLQSLHIEGLP